MKGIEQKSSSKISSDKLADELEKNFIQGT
jgi:hypothetical protein